MPASAKKHIANSNSISVAEAKANLSSVLSGVEKRKRPVTILRRGVPVAQIVPISPAEPISGYGWMRGTIKEIGDLVSPTGVEWTAGDE